MTALAAVLTDEEARIVRDNEPTFSDRQGIDLPTKLAALITNIDAEFNKFFATTAVVLNTASTVVIAAGLAFDGKPVTATMMEADGAIHILHAVWDGSGNLTVTTSAVTTADRTIGVIVDGR